MTFAELLRTYSCLPNDSNERLTALENSPKYATSVEKLWVSISTKKASLKKNKLVNWGDKIQVGIVTVWSSIFYWSK